MTDEQREYARRYYAEHREEILAKQKAAYKAKVKKKKQAEYKRKWNAEHREEQREKRRAKWQRRNTPEFRAKRRADYRMKHANDPMTEHRKAMIAAFEERTKYTKEEWNALRMAKIAEAQAKKDMNYQDAEEQSVRKRETVIKYIDQWTRRKVFATTSVKNGEFMSEADVRAYYQEALRYFRLQAQLDATAPTDYSTRNILSYKMRCIEYRFNTLLNKRTNTRSKLKEE